MISFLFRILVIVTGVFITPVALLTAKDGKFRRCFYWFDNDEDGYNGDKHKFYSNHLGRKPNWLDCYVWTALRNPAYNLRYVNFFSRDVTDNKVKSFRGNTYAKGYFHSFDKLRKAVWFYFNYDGLRCFFYQRPVTKKRSFRLFVGWKLYPDLYLSNYWMNRIKEKGWPKHKERAVFVLEFKFTKS